MALEEWRHWLEGAEKPFLVWIDHKNLKYIKIAKHLNSKRARWALFVSCFNFSLSYSPGSRHMKPDALSHQFTEEGGPSEPDTILSSHCLITSAQFSAEQEELGAMYQHPLPGNKHRGKLFVPVYVHPQILQWFHASRLTSQRFLWPQMQKDMLEYVTACPNHGSQL